MAKNVDWRNLNQRILLKEDQYTKFKDLRIYCGTYNVNGKSPDEFLSPWLCIDESIDIYAIGFQEVVDLTTTSLLLKTDWAEKEESWTNYVNDELLDSKNFKSNPNYKLVSKIRMFGLYLLVYVSEKLHKKALSEVISSYVATGILTVGNKGSVGVSLKIYETRICFVCSHFAADTDKIEKRNADFRSTRQYLKFQFDQDQNNYIDLDQHDMIFWFGDLNYRLDLISLNETLKMINSSCFDELIKYDQLTNERTKSRVFEHYEEGKFLREINKAYKKEAENSPNV
jgi:phosphatidylinositol-bisphosphatase